MRQAHPSDSHLDLPVKRPVCPSCGLEMWLVRLEHELSGSEAMQLYRFKCEACDTQAVIPQL
jgi:transposase-like protein